MSGENVKLIGAWPSPFVLRARIALNLKSVPYEFLEETFGSKSELLLKSNPVHKKIPVLIHNEKPICESLIIVQYIDEVWSSGPAILPADPYDRSTAKFWAAYSDEKFFPSMREINTAPNDEARQAAIARVHDGLLLFEEAHMKESRGKPFFGGAHIGYLDIAFGGFLGWVRAASKMLGQDFIDEAKYPGLNKWADAFCAHPAVCDVMPEADKLVEFAMMMKEKMRAGPPK